MIIYLFIFYNLESLSPYVELQKSRLDALKKKYRKLFLKLEKKSISFIVKKNFGALNQTNLIWDII